MIHDGFRPHDWANFMREPEYQNVILDTHRYQCFTDDDRKRDGYRPGAACALERKKLLDEMQKQLPCIVGEWSCALPPESLRGRTGLALDLAMRAYGDAELINFRRHPGLVLLDLENRGRRWLELPRLRPAGVAAGKVRPLRYCKANASPAAILPVAACPSKCSHWSIPRPGSDSLRFETTIEPGHAMGQRTSRAPAR